MEECRAEVLVVESDEFIASTIRHHLGEIPGLSITHARTIDDAACEELTTQHDLIVTNALLSDGTGFELMSKVRPANDCPVIFVADAPSVEEVILALRLGVSDVVPRPIDMEYLAASVDQWIRVEHERRQSRRRQRRLRKVTSRVLRERRETRQQMELICRDIVQAYRRLAQEVTDAGILPAS